MSVETHSYEGYVGYVRIDDENLASGTIDMLSALNTMRGMESALKFFVRKNDSSFANTETINYPVVTRDGCWEILIPAVGTVIGVPLTAAATAYAVKAAQNLADGDTKGKSSKDVFKSAITGVQSVIKISKHLGTVRNRHVLKAKVIDRDNIILRNDTGAELSVTKAELDNYQNAPSNLISNLAYSATGKRTVSVGYVEGKKGVEERIDHKSRDVFIEENPEKEKLFPELVHGQHVKLIGKVTRGNQRSNTIGFEYEGHIITCEPIKNLVTNFLDAHYKKCEIYGIVSRSVDPMLIREGKDRIRIHFTDLKVISELSGNQTSLLH